MTVQETRIRAHQFTPMAKRRIFLKADRENRPFQLTHVLTFACLVLQSSSSFQLSPLVLFRFFNKFITFFYPLLNATFNYTFIDVVFLVYLNMSNVSYVKRIPLATLALFSIFRAERSVFSDLQFQVSYVQIA